MKEINLFLKKHIFHYSNAKGRFFRVCLPNGFGRQIRKQGFISEELAIEWAKPHYFQRLRSEGIVGGIVAESTFEEAANLWLTNKRVAGLSSQSLMVYESELRIRLVPYFGHLKLKTIGRVQILNYIQKQRENDLGSKLLNFSVSVFKSVIKEADANDFAINPDIFKIKTPQVISTLPRFWDKQQLDYFLNRVKDFPQYKLWKFAAYTGLRAGEIAGLKWDCVFLQRSFGDHTGIIDVRRSIEQKTHKLKETTKTKERRLVPILPESRVVLESFEKNGEFVFGGPTPIITHHFARDLQKACDLTNCPKIPFHGLRHTFCSLLESSGLPRRVVAEIMGHKDLNTTSRYSHVSSQVMGNEVSKWLANQQKTSNLRVVESIFTNEK
jgi:integrase